MGHPFSHPSAKSLLRRVAVLFSASDTFILKDSNIVFVCGGPLVKGSMDDKPSMRKLFCDYAKENLKILRLFLAEDAEKDYVSHDDPDFHNIGEFEEIIGSVSDCLIIFPESPGSFAELGYFSAQLKLRKKILIVNDYTLQGEDSFISRGPIEIIDKHSDFKPTIQMQFTQEANFDMVKKRLEKRITGSKRSKFQFTDYNSLTGKEKFFIVFSLVELFVTITFDALEFCFKSVFAHSNKEDLRHLLSILVAAKLVVRKGPLHDYFSVSIDAKPFIEFDSLNAQEFRLEVLEFYQREFPQVAVLCTESEQ